jgi:hypothetical protein
MSVTWCLLGVFAINITLCRVFSVRAVFVDLHFNWAGSLEIVIIDVCPRILLLVLLLNTEILQKCFISVFATLGVHDCKVQVTCDYKKIMIICVCKKEAHTY